MKPTAIASGVIYTPLVGKIEEQFPPNNNDNYYDYWHVEMEDMDDQYPLKSICGSFNSQEEAKGFMDGWNAHRRRVSGTLFRNRINRKK